MRNRFDVLAQGVIFGARASHGASGLLLVAPAALRCVKERGGAKQCYREPQQCPTGVSPHPFLSWNRIQSTQELLMQTGAVCFKVAPRSLDKNK